MTSQNLTFNTSGLSTNGSRDLNVELILWNMPFTAIVITIVYLASNLTVSVSSNCLLIVIINNSPTLKTPANSHLINICANNLVLSVSMCISLLSILLPPNLDNRMNILTGIHLFLISNCLIQYWGTFASIGFYRSKIIRSPSMATKRRRQIITRCLTVSWTISVLVSLMLCLSHLEEDAYACMTLNPFQKSFLYCGKGRSISIQRMSIILINVIVICGIFVIVFVSYHKVFKVLNHGKRIRRNKILPMVRSMSYPSEIGEASLNHHRSSTTSDTNVTNGGDKSPYIVSRRNMNTDGDLIVHYQRNSGVNVLTYEDILALENPILATSMRGQQTSEKRRLQLTRSNISNASVKSRYMDFSDISAGADLQRFQNLKNSSALRNHFLRRDRVGFNSATKNSLVMLVSFIVCSSPMFVCMLPQVLSRTKENHRVLILLFTKLAFYLNAPIYPLWYLVQNSRVRKCLGRAIEGVLIKANLRR